MWIVILSVVLIALQVYREVWRKQAKSNRETSGAAIGTWNSLKACLYLGLNSRKVPGFQLLGDLARSHGSFFILDIPIRAAIVSDLRTAKTIMNSPKWTNRVPSWHFLKEFAWGQQMGLFFGNDGYAKDGRKVSLKILHHIDFYRPDKMEQLILIEFNEVEKRFFAAIKESGTDEGFVEIYQTFQRETLNVIYQMLTGESFENEDRTVDALLPVFNEVNQSIRVGTRAPDFYPMLNRVPFLEIKAMGILADYLYTDFQCHIDKRKRSGTYRTNPVDFIDHGLLEIERRVGGEEQYWTEQNMKVCMRDLLFGALDSTNAVVEHTLLNLALRQDMQKRMQAEIDEIIGSGLPSSSDKGRMLYTGAFIDEILRYSTPTPLDGRTCIEDDVVNGELLPKGTPVLLNLYEAHHDKNVWSDPEIFRPERFLNETQDALINQDKLVAFGCGKRGCIGESSARLFIFLFVVSLMQKFVIEISDKHPPPSMEMQHGISREPAPFHLKIRARISK